MHFLMNFYIDQCLICASIVTIVTIFFQLMDGLKMVDDYEVTLALYNWYV